MNTEEFVSRSNKIHGEGTYNYDSVVYTDLKTKVEINCPKHGSFLQSPDKHLYCKQGCTKCGIEKNAKNSSYTTEKFIENARKVHGDKYDYSKVNYLNNSTKVKIVCPYHGSFWQVPNNHTTGKNGCPICGNIKISNKLTLSHEQFIEDAKRIHGDKYNYEKITSESYKTVTDKIEILCSEHGPFWQTPISHKRGSGCPICGDERTRISRLLTLEEFLEKAIKIHDKKYDYSKSKYINAHTDIEIICKNHASFWQLPNNHLRGYGCPKCNSNTSSGEKGVLSYINGLGFDAKKERLTNFEIDIYLPYEKLGIEYNGLYWHREEILGKNYHIDKTNLCNKQGIRLIHIFEDEWQTKKELVKNKLAHILGVSKEKSLGARKTSVVNLSSLETRGFLDNNHIQGYLPSAVRLGLIYQKKLVAVATFSLSRFDTKDSWEIIRYATSQPIQGGFSKLLKHFLTLRQDVKRIVSYSDLRWSTGEVYKQFGFTLESISKPGYFWCKGSTRHNRQHFMKHKLSKILPEFDPNKTEEENCINSGYWKVYDCGQQKWILNTNHSSPCIEEPKSTYP